MVLAQAHVGVVLGPHVLTVLELPQVAGDLLELQVCLVVVEGNDGHSVFGLEAVAIGGLNYHKIYIIDEQDIGEIPVEHSEILHVEALDGLVASFPEETMRDELPLRIQVVDDHIGVALVTGGEDNDLEVLAQLPQALDSVGPDVDARFDPITVGEDDLD